MRVLEALGLDDAHTAVYRFVLGKSAVSPEDASQSLGIPLARTRGLMDELERLGLLAHHVTQNDRFVASPPAIALKPMLLERERGLARAHEALFELAEVYRQSAEQHNSPDVVDVILGPDAVRQRLDQLQASAVHEVRALVLTQVALLASTDNVEEDRALERGVRYRVIVERGVLERPGYLDLARGVGELGEEIRVLPALPTRMFIADDAMALLPMRSHGDHSSTGALLVHPSGLLDLVIAIFEEYWKSATRLLIDEEALRTRDGVDLDLLKLLLLGLTDATVAGQLGISVRTVQRRIAEMMEMAGVTTRIQLGAEAVRRSWL